MGQSLRGFIGFRMGVLLLLMVGVVGEGYGQRVYATSVASAGDGTFEHLIKAISSDGVSQPVTSPPYAKITVTGPGSLIVGSEKTGSVILTFNDPIPSNAIIYIKVSNRVLQGSSSIVVQAYNSITGINGFNGEFITMADGSQYYRVPSSSEFNSVRLIAKGVGGALGINLSASINIHYAFYESSNTKCAEVLGYTDDISGLAIASISNPEQAIDNDLSTKSSFLVALGIATTLKQTVFFSNLSNAGDAATITFAVAPAVLKLDLFKNINISAFNGSAFVSSIGLNSILSLDLLGLLSSGNRYTVSYIPEGVFDRIEVSMSNLVGALGSFYLHEVQHTPAKPNVPYANFLTKNACVGSPAILTATSTGNVLRWYDEVNNGSPLHIGNSYTTPVITSVDTTFYYVAAAWDAICPSESERVKIAIIAQPKPDSPQMTISSLID